jgi:hypothetical protein
LVPIPAEPVSLAQFFQTDVMVTVKEWIAKYVSRKGELTEKGRAKTRKFNADVLRMEAIRETNRQSFVTNRLAFARSLAASAVIRRLFGAHYPTLDRTIVCPRGLSPVCVHTDFDFAAVPQELDCAPVRLSPVITQVLGRTGMGESLLAMAAVAHTFAQSIETVHAFVELVVTDNRIEDLAWEPDELIAARDAVEKRMLDVAPPAHRTATVEACVGWYEQCRALLETAANPDCQPVEAVPWY